MENTNGIFPKGKPASADFFTGTAFLSALIEDTEKQYNCTVYDVAFEAGARKNWHKHPGGQFLLVTDGRGYYQEHGKAARLLQKGDVVEIPPEVEHWHGAAPDSDFTHIAINPNTQKGEVVWLGPVTDVEYTEACKTA
jgi:quercetin dioxygenase-like cupin family protein